MPAIKALKKAGLQPHKYLPKEALSMVNGTTTMTGIAALAVERADRILNAAILCHGAFCSCLEKVMLIITIRFFRKPSLSPARLLLPRRLHVCCGQKYRRVSWKMILWRRCRILIRCAVRRRYWGFCMTGLTWIKNGRDRSQQFQ